MDLMVSPSTLLRVVSLSNHGSRPPAVGSSGMTLFAYCDTTSLEGEKEGEGVSVKAKVIPERVKSNGT